MRADRGQDHRVHRRKQDRAAGRQRIGRRARGRRDDQAIGPICGRVTPLDRHGEVDDATHRRLHDGHVVEGTVFPEALTLPEDANRQQHPLADGHAASQQRLEGREHLVERRRGQEAETTQVHAEQRYAEVADGAGHREKRPVATEHDDEVDLRRQLLLAGRGDGHVRQEARGLLLDHRAQPAGGEPGQQPVDHRFGLDAAGLGDDADARHARASTLRLISDSRSLAVRPCVEKCRKNS